MSAAPDELDAVFPLLVADIFEAAGLLRRLGERTARVAGQTQARWQLLSVVSVGDWTVPAAAERLGVSRQAVQRIANDLLDAGLARFAANPHHRRSPFLRLTEQGVQVLQVITRQAAADHHALVASLVAQAVDLARTRSELRRLTGLIQAELDAPDVQPAK